MNDFIKGLITSVVFSLIFICLILTNIHSNQKNREFIEYVERQMEIEVLREDYIDRDATVFLEHPGIRGAADGAATGFDRRVDEILQRFINRAAD